ncbi:MAG: DUF177 domain-containing protein [Acidimicrobiales bacterium]|nr:DUF177 domain-containing protein [Acidimicrobiales bacterium]MCB9372015.1 DUF177 domain-containing protein [Microthrixaceae bacterium]
MARRPLRVGVGDLVRHPGTRHEVERSVPAGGLGSLVVGASRVDPGVDVEVDLVLESQPGTVVASGTVATRWHGECRRCLGEVVGELRAELREVFGDESEGDPDDGDFYALEGDEVDLEPLVRDAVLLNLPVAPLCGDDCRGPVPDAFVPAGDDDPDGGSDDPSRDPRWAALDDLDFD